jgi:DNA repair ATPase RecN
VDGEDDLALQYLAMAEEQTYRDEAIIEEAKYITYKNMGDMTNALYWLERTNSRLSETLLQASDQPVLNYQIDLLQSSLDKEAHELMITRQRNISVYVLVALLLSLGIGFLRSFTQKKNRDIERYIETIRELNLTKNSSSDSLSEAVDRLYNDRLNDLNRLCETYYEYDDTSRHAVKVFEQVRETIESIKSDEARLEELEKLVNSCRGNLMVKLREQCPKLNVKEQRVVLYSYAGFSSRAICTFMETNPVALSKIKYRIKLKIKDCGAKDADLLIESIGER